MKVKFLLFTLGIYVMQGCASMDIRTDKTMMQLLLDTRDMSESNPERSNACFIYYVPLLNAASDKFESDYAACMTNATNARSLANKAAIVQQDALANAVAGTCSNICLNASGSAIDAFNCYEKEGASTAKQMYQVSANAVEYRQSLEVEYTAIDGVQNMCTNATEREYIEDTADIYEELHLCLSGQLLPSPTTEDTTIRVEGTTTITHYSTMSPTQRPEAMILKNKNNEQKFLHIMRPQKIQ